MAEITPALIGLFSQCDLLLIDGTFWTNDELILIHGGARTARDMGHIPISGPGGCLELLAGLPSKTRKVFLHINNTNPILDEMSLAHATATKAGWVVGEDGMEIIL